MKTFHCNCCSQLVFFENVRCERCESLLGYVPELAEISAFEDAGEGRWRSLHPRADGALFRQCHNYAVENICNWMIPADSPDTLCHACQLTLTIPNLSAPDNRLYWYRLEGAKRRLLYTLAGLGVDVKSRQADPEHGLAFEFLEDGGDGSRVMTGHDNGLITLNIAEADDAHREKVRTSMGEPYRTLLGHFRHETGHYYFDQLVQNDPRWLEPYRTLFGDERADYGEALNAYYRNGAPADWQASYISAYATMHPWEDWAETWAHYLLIVDVLDTSTSYGLALLPDDPREPTLTDRTPVEDASFENLMKRWFPLTYALNSLNRSLGMKDGYPFTLAAPVVDKLRFVHRVIAAAGEKAALLTAETRTAGQTAATDMRQAAGAGPAAGNAAPEQQTAQPR
ncbi:zinc-binding metallopeptidase family protein [Paraburkholderia panacisoli]|uniref:zinc-binding metallopeptidase family protein n=1 Tax=Paraburkholderia panacisoli TaxID=2603818 RepID=UPI001FE83BE2|nr:putative zinc-binding metallopeptidase [Paraburkholderia panacisoli]